MNTIIENAAIEGMEIPVVGSVSGKGMIGQNRTNIIIPNSSWMARGEVARLDPPNPSYLAREKQVTCSEYPAIICGNGNADKVQRKLQHIVFEHPDNPQTMLLANSYVWYSPEPFAVLVKIITRNLKEARERRARPNVDYRIIWSRQVHNGERSAYLPTPKFMVVTDVKDRQWVGLTALAELVGITPLSIIKHYLGMRCLALAEQPTFVYAEDEEGLFAGRSERFPKVVGTHLARFSDSPPPPDDMRSVSNIWVALLSAQNVARLVSLGCKEGLLDFMSFEIFI